VPIIIVAFIAILFAQAVKVYFEVLEFTQENLLTEESLKDIQDISAGNLLSILLILVFFSAVFIALYFIDRIRVMKQTKLLTDNIERLNIVSMIKENKSDGHRG
jgi:flagellar biosynthesis protein FlhB